MISGSFRIPVKCGDMELAGPGFEPGSGRPKRPMIVHYTIPPYKKL